MAAAFISVMFTFQLALTGRGFHLFVLLAAVGVFAWSTWQDQRQEQ
jgi:predicted negative regulator of RcsB-dependent stress response